MGIVFAEPYGGGFNHDGLDIRRIGYGKRGQENQCGAGSY